MLFEIIRVICMSSVYFLLGGLLIGLTGSSLLLMMLLHDMVLGRWQKRASSAEIARLHADINAFLAQIRKDA